MPTQIIIRGARLHNLKNITVDIPKNQLVVLTGVSGSGKSTLGFDILSREGQRQYLEALGFVAVGFNKSSVDSIEGLSPSISIDQHLTNHNPRSTVGTATDVFSFLRILFARIGHRPCPVCSRDIPPYFMLTGNQWENDFESEENTTKPDEVFPCPHCNAPTKKLGMEHFSFNKPEGACPTCTGLGIVHRPNIDLIINMEKSILEGAIAGWESLSYINYYIPILKNAATYYGLDFNPGTPVKKYSQPLRDLLIYGVDEPNFRKHFPNIEPPKTTSKGKFEGIATNLLRRYTERSTNSEYHEKQAGFLIIQTCPDCAGTRLSPASRSVSIYGKNIIEVSKLSITDLNLWLDELSANLTPDETLISGQIMMDLHQRLHRLIQVGAGYLTIERSSLSLSAGETQRLRLASLLGSGLSGVTYVLDEPTIGLHQRDTLRMIEILRQLRDLGNNVLVIEHDLETINAADYVIDFGPGAGRHGGEVIASGTPHQIAQSTKSVTGNYLSGRTSLPIPPRHRTPGNREVVIIGAREHNLKDITVNIPLGMLVVVTGVSGSGKSSLIFDILDRALRKHLYRTSEEPGLHDAITGYEHINKVITIDQKHITRIPRSNVATYSDVFTSIRTTFAYTSEAQSKGFSTRYFSFNLPGGRCEHCQGAGVLTVKMHFLPEVEVPCPVCRGRRFTPDILAVPYKEHNISQVLDLTVEEAEDLFKDVPTVHSRLKVLSDVGLGYLQLGQPATTLSGGEAQRIKLAKELGRKANSRTLYLLDEPTTGLHIDDTARLLTILQRLVQTGSSVIVVEHNLEVIKTADWVIDLGPEGGAEGGYLVAQGTPEHIAEISSSFTGQFLKHCFE